MCVWLALELTKCSTFYHETKLSRFTAEPIKTSAIKRAGPSIVGIDIDGDREAWKIHIVQAARAHAFEMGEFCLRCPRQV